MEYGSVMGLQLPMSVFIREMVTHTRYIKGQHKRSKLGKTSHHFKLIRVYYRHADSPDFKRIISTAEGN